VDVADQLAAIQAGSASSWPANRRQLHAEHGLKPRGLKAEVQATSTREQRHDAPLVQTRRIHCLWHVGIAHLYTDHRSQLRIDPSVCLQMADEARKFGRYRIAVAIFVRVAQRRRFLDLGFNSVAFRHRQCWLYRLDQCDRGGDGVPALARSSLIISSGSQAALGPAERNRISATLSDSCLLISIIPLV